MGDYKSYRNEQMQLSSSPQRFMDELEKRLSIKEPDIKEDDYQFVSLDEILTTQYPAEQWLVDKLIPKDGITCIGGLPATMKSYFSNYLALCVVEGRYALERYRCQQGNILFIDKENKLARIQDRFLRLGISSEGAKKIFYLKGNFIVDNQRDLAAACAFIRDHKIQLTYIDTLIRVHSRNENEASEVNRIFHAFKEIQLAGSAICFIHHFNKRGSFGLPIDVRDQLRGSGDILAMVDSFIALTRKENFLEVEQAKSRDEVVIPKFLMHPTFEENKTFFNYIREVEKDERIQAVLLGDQILGLLSQNSYSRKQLIELLTSETASRASIDRALTQLKSEHKIASYGNTSKMFFTLSKQEEIL